MTEILKTERKLVEDILDSKKLSWGTLVKVVLLNAMVNR